MQVALHIIYSLSDGCDKIVDGETFPSIHPLLWPPCHLRTVAECLLYDVTY